MRRDDDGAADRDVVRVRERHGDGVVLEVAPEELVVGADDDAERHPVRQRRQREVVGGVRDGLGVLPHGVVEPEVELVEDERLLDDARRDVREVLLVVVDLERGEHRVVVADVDTGDPVADRVRFCASSGEVMVIFPVLSRLKMQTSFCFSMAPCMTARPAGSTATDCPGTARRIPDLPKVSLWTARSWLVFAGTTRG